MPELPPPPGKKRPLFFLPRGAHVPREWKRKVTLEQMVVVVPSWGTTGAEEFEITVRLHDGLMSCSCPGFRYHGRCHHIRGLLWFSYKPARRAGVQATSLVAFRSIQDVISARERAVFDELLKGPGTNKELAGRLGWPINCVTPRVKALRDQGAVAEYGRVIGSCGRPETVWVAVDTLQEAVS